MSLFQHVIPTIELRDGKLSYNSQVFDSKEVRFIKEPKYTYLDRVRIKNHPQIIGQIDEIMYHFKNDCPIYYLLVDGKKCKTRYYASDLEKV